MRSPIASALYLCILSIAANEASAAPSAALSVIRKGHKIDQTTKITRNGEEWACSTEIMPYYPLAAKPEILGEKVKLAAKAPAGCEDVIEVTMLDSRQKPVKGKACATDPSVKAFLQKLSKTCGRS